MDASEIERGIFECCLLGGYLADTICGIIGNYYPLHYCSFKGGQVIIKYTICFTNLILDILVVLIVSWISDYSIFTHLTIML